MREAIWRTIMRVGFLRTLYAKRLLAYMAKSKRKQRALPPELRELDIAMSRLPEDQRRAALEEALSGKSTEAMGREMRRAASRQSRQSGRGGSHRRPGAVRTKDPSQAGQARQQPPPQGGQQGGRAGARPGKRSR